MSTYNQGSGDLKLSQISRCCCTLAIIIGLVPPLLFSLINFTETLHVGVGEERVLFANSGFFKFVEVSPLNGAKTLPTYLYTFPQAPRLREISKSRQTYYSSLVPSYGNEHWSFWLNKGSIVDFGYDILYDSPLVFVVVKGRGVNDRVYDFRMEITKSGCVSYLVLTDGVYTFVLHNENREDIPLESMYLEMTSTRYDLNESNSRCLVTLMDPCSLKLTNGGTEFFILETSADNKTDIWPLRVHYALYWEGYKLMIGSIWLFSFISVIMILSSEDRIVPQIMKESPSSSTPFINKEREKREEERGEGSSNSSSIVNQLGSEGRRGEEREGDMCSICMDSRKDSAFANCGHTVTCFPCGNKLCEENPPLCPICRQTIQKVVRIINV